MLDIAIAIGFIVLIVGIGALFAALVIGLVSIRD